MKPQTPKSTIQLTLEESLKLAQTRTISKKIKKEYIRDYLKNRRREMVSLDQIKRDYPECFRIKKKKKG